MSTWFVVLAAITLAGACAAMMLRSMVHCALSLAVSFAGFGAMYINLGAQFLGLAQLLVYVGAIAVLIVFVVLLTRTGETKPPASHRSFTMSGMLVAGAVFVVMAWACLHSGAVRLPGRPALPANTRQLGVALMDGYVLPLEVIGLMLTAALIGGAIVAMKQKQGAR